MARKKTESPDQRALNKLVDTFLFGDPENTTEGRKKTVRYETGIVMFDALLNGGLPVGRAVAIGTEPGIGKTTLVLQACANVIRKYNKNVYYLDAEGGATYELIDAMGISDLLYHPKENPEGKFYLLSVSTIQQISKIFKQVCASDETAVIVIDSDTSVTDQLIIDDEFLGSNKNDAAPNARMWSKVAKPMSAILKQSLACLIIIHQARLNLQGFVPKVEAAGGRALKHLVSVEIWGRRTKWIGDGGVFVKHKSEAIGSLVKLNTEKNRLTKPFDSIEIPIFFGKGVSNKWAYKSWLEENTIEDKSTGEVVSFLKKAGAGYYTLTLPSGQYKCRGDEEAWVLIDDHLEEIVDLVNSLGGFKLERAEAEEE